jgi:hypothetical protein
LVFGLPPGSIVFPNCDPVSGRKGRKQGGTTLALCLRLWYPEKKNGVSDRASGEKFKI